MPRWPFLSILPVILIAAGCAEKSSGPATADVKGKVTLDGTPLATGKIVFDEGPGVPAAELDIKDGAYSGKASVGSKTVRISSYKTVPQKGPMTGPGGEMQENTLPPKYHSGSKETREVKVGGPNEFDFAVTSK